QGAPASQGAPAGQGAPAASAVPRHLADPTSHTGLPAPTDLADVVIPAGLPGRVDQPDATGRAGGFDPGDLAPLADLPAPAELPSPSVSPTAAATGAPPVVDGLLGPASAGPSEQVRPALSELARGLRDDGGRASLVIRLDPPELGPVLVRLTVIDGRVDVTLRAPEAAAARGLAGASEQVQRLLAEHGLDLSSFDVTQSALSGGASGGPASEQDRRSARQDPPDRATTGPAGAAETRTDAVGVSVTDDAPAGGSSAGTWL
ncbi:MAG: flagellar hook-length control protein FliK, partial [Actinomycetota bacterium]|nr:flagellar hook-length control protein FliK [Actinomycetota bacterium]